MSEYMTDYMEYLDQNGKVIWATPRRTSSTSSGADLAQWNLRGSDARPISLHEIPKSAIGFTYRLLGAGGGGGAGGRACGGGGGGAGSFVEDRVIFSDLIQETGTPIENLSIESQLGAIGSGGEGLNLLGYGNPGIGGGESTVIVRSIGQDTPPIILAVAKGGFGALGGTAFQGFGFGEFGTTYTEDGGMGELLQTNERRSRDGPDRRSTDLNHNGDGGNGGAIGAPGLSGKPGWFSIEFF